MRDGYGSKKFWFAIGVCVFAFLYALLASTKVPEMKAMFDTFTQVLEVVTAAYLTGNVANKWVVGKVGDPTAIPPQASPTPQNTKPKSADPLDRDFPGGGAR